MLKNFVFQDQGGKRDLADCSGRACSDLKLFV